MSISNIYTNLILEDIIRQILDEGITLTVTELVKRYNLFVEGLDLSQPLFNLDNAIVSPLEHATASKWNTTNQEIQKDIQVAYTELFSITSNSMNVFDRWRSEINLLETRLKGLDRRISNLIDTQTTLNTNFIYDTFANTTQVDHSLTTALVDLTNQNVVLNRTNTSSTRLVLNQIRPDDIQFTVLSRSNLLSVNTSPNGQLLNAVLDNDSYWQSIVRVSDPSLPITSELRIKLSDTPVDINKITLCLHASNTTSSIQITPLLSLDGVNFSQLPIDDVSLSVIDRATWIFPTQSLQYVKFIMTKTGYDFVEDRAYMYEFGTEDIAFYTDTFDPDTSDELVSTALSVPDIDNQPIEFDSITLEACEKKPLGTTIDYYVAPLLLSTSTPVWHPISSVKDPNPLHPTTLSFGDITDITVSGVSINYLPSASQGFINPDRNYTLVSLDTNNTVTTSSVVASAQRYALVNSNDRLLNHEIDGDLSIIDNSIEIFRNVGTKHDTTVVRTIQRGWGYAEPYYYCVIEVTNQDGIVQDYGDKEIIVDSQAMKGKVTIPAGIHTIKVYKSNWLTVVANATSLDNTSDSTSLINLDPLFPFNHKYLIEGYTLSDTNNPYIGMDIFAEYYLSQVSIVDFVHNIDRDDYSKFSIDIDTLDSSATIDGSPGSIGPSTIFMVKSNENYSDFLDELFTIRCRTKNQLYKYLKLKAVLSTTDAEISPSLEEYKLTLRR